MGGWEGGREGGRRRRREEGRREQGKGEGGAMKEGREGEKRGRERRKEEGKQWTVALSWPLHFMSHVKFNSSAHVRKLDSLTHATNSLSTSPTLSLSLFSLSLIFYSFSLPSCIPLPFSLHSFLLLLPHTSSSFPFTSSLSLPPSSSLPPSLPPSSFPSSATNSLSGFSKSR